MVHCARKGGGDYLTFGEFCIFVTEMRRYYKACLQHCDYSSELSCHDQEVKLNDANPSSGTAKKNGCSYDVFLGGSCDPTTWRKDLAIPHLKAAGITFYNPQVEHWVPELIGQVPH